MCPAVHISAWPQAAAATISVVCPDPSMDIIHGDVDGTQTTTAMQCPERHRRMTWATRGLNTRLYIGLPLTWSGRSRWQR